MTPPGPQPGERLDWEAARVRLERARAAIERAGARPPEETARILRARAQELAAPLASTEPAAEPCDLVAFGLAGEQYAIELAQVLEVVSLRGLTRLPGTSPVHMGVLNYHGWLVPVLDLRHLLGAPEGAAEPGVHAVVATGAGARLGIATGTPAGLVRVAAAELTGGPRPPVKAVTGGMIAVLDLEALARDPRIVVSDDVG